MTFDLNKTETAFSSLLKADMYFAINSHNYMLVAFFIISI